MNRFQKKKEKGNIKILVQIFIFAAVFALVWCGISSLSEDTSDRQKESLLEAVRRDMVYCYAMEGRYPESVEYMESHYGLTYDKERYFIDYEIIGSNLMPDVMIIEKREAAQ